MTYTAYLRFYGIKDTKENREGWLYSLWSKGIVYMENGKFYYVETGKEVN